MLWVYTRHRPGCSHTDIHYRRCPCPKWIRGRLDDETHVRRSARTRSWEDAVLMAREMERQKDLCRGVTVEEAIKAYLAEQVSKTLQLPTLTLTGA